MSDIFDCLILGAGPAGLTAALYLRRFRRSVLVADAGHSRAALIPRSHNVPGFPGGVRGPDLLSRLREQLAPFDPVEWAGRVAGLDRVDGDLWRAELEERTVFGRTVLFATGVIDRRPPIPQPERAIQSGLLRFCPICDGFEALLDRIAVIGGDEHAAREALFLRAYSPSISVLVLGPNHSVSRSSREMLEAAGVPLVPVQPGSLSVQDDRLHARRMDGLALEPFDVAYGALGVEPQSDLAAAIGVVVDDSGCILVDEHQRTFVPNVYAAGDVARGLDQISVAVGEAAIAATAIHNSLPPLRVVHG
ncbi:MULTISPECIES: NAD(P)/FAD-dependent oxidoreductase [unclassified Phenylobacterium]|uniref:NAD(P)/FAD-dependent oxidoreductase n=1 Tax=unclassified Phenylobacterium TaxID=2640670 RepID=UPI0009EC8F93|nr:MULTISPECIES: NAD(P)/FAD-dependent oxidoreductase [unclassified Phenylobacterium]